MCIDASRTHLACTFTIEDGTFKQYIGDRIYPTWQFEKGVLRASGTPEELCCFPISEIQIDQTGKILLQLDKSKKRVAYSSCTIGIVCNCCPIL